MTLLEKKRCDVCGARIRLSANKSPKNVILCKNCASRLSVWFTGEKGSSLTEIREQLAFREANRREVLAFQTTRSYGTYTKLYVDEPAGKFLICGSSNFLEVNPDVLSFDQVTGCEIEIPETRHEIRRRDPAGNSVRCRPPRYAYSYDFRICIKVNHPFIEEMQFQLNGARIPTGEYSMKAQPSAFDPDPWRTEYPQYLQTAREIQYLLSGRSLLRLVPSM